MARESLANRAELVEALHEAAELEHGLLVQYLYAGFTVKVRPEEGIATLAAELGRRWKGSILEVAHEEMIHLGLVSNLLAAIGEPAWFRRPGFPAENRYFPHRKDGAWRHVVFSLERLSHETVARFVRFEAPNRPGLVPPEYETIGALYGLIAAYVENADERELFVGDPARQDSGEWDRGFELEAVRDRKSALAAIERIVEEGEGTPIAGEDSHWARFRRIAAEMSGAPDVWPAGPNPRTAPAVEAVPVTIVSDAGTAATMELFDRVYAAMVMLLGLYYRFPPEFRQHQENVRRLLRRTMSGVVRPLGELLVQLPSGSEGVTGGPEFAPVDGQGLPGDVHAALADLQERLEQDAATARELSAPGGPLARRSGLDGVVALLARNVGTLREAVGP